MRMRSRLFDIVAQRSARWLLLVWAGGSVFYAGTLQGQQRQDASQQQRPEWKGKFEQLGSLLPTPNTHRTASGAPGKDYWQQQADYDISVTLNDQNQTITGEETITYHNNSPDKLDYLWLQLDQNVRAKGSDHDMAEMSRLGQKVMAKRLQSTLKDYDFKGGFNIHWVKDNQGKTLSYTINKTMMRIDLPKGLKSGAKYAFRLAWDYNINDRMMDFGRSGYEYFPKDDNYLYTIAQFYPRMAVYNNEEGWQNKQFLGNGEFALSFGHFRLAITVPADHVVAATGQLLNASEVLSATQRKRLEQARKSFEKPVLIIPQAEAQKNETEKVFDKQKTWHFQAKDVRDVAFAASRKFIWDAQAVKLEKHNPLAMSFYPKEGNPLWEKESTKAVANTLRTYSKHTIDYPYPVAISVHAASIGMEYPMICFNWGRPDEAGNYTDEVKWRTIGVIIHEVGHNFFPMIINSDERQWTWMDEGLNTFVQYLTEREYYPELPSRRGPPEKIVHYMKGDKQNIRPIMTNSEQIIQFGNNAYGKPATALNILRETVMGPELFDYAFKTYAQRWAFKHPAPADFFRTMEDASAVDLDWFWRGWFYGTDHVDISLESVKYFRSTDSDSQTEGEHLASHEEVPAGTLPDKPVLLEIEQTDPRYYGEFMNRVDTEKVRLRNKDKHFYELTFTNHGGLVMPVIIGWRYEGETTSEEDDVEELETLPVEIWRKGEHKAVKAFAKDQKVKAIVLDPHLATADVNTDNNFLPRQAETLPSSIQTLPATLEVRPEEKKKKTKRQRRGLFGRRKKQNEKDEE